MTSSRVLPEDQVGAQPKVSVVITTYNHERYLADALKSALSQETSFPFEVVVGEDCSTDHTRPLLESFFGRHPDVIRMVLAEQNLGPNRMYVEVMRHARGEYVAILDGDDYWLSPDKLQRQVAFLDNHPDRAACFHDMLVRYEAQAGEPRPDLAQLPHHTFTFAELLAKPFIPTSSIMHRRIGSEELEAWFARVAPEAWQDLVLIDWITLLLLGRHGDVEYLRGLQGVHRIHNAGVWSSKYRHAQIAEERAVLRHLHGIVEPEQEEVLRTNLARCDVQHAVEQAGLRYDRLVAVVSAVPPHPWYFNGRPVWQLGDDGEPGKTDLVLELKRLQRVAAADPAAPHWKVGAPIRVATDRSIYCVVQFPDEWFQRMPDLRDYLSGFRPLMTGNTYAIYELPGQRVREREVVAVELGETSTRLHGRHIDGPKPGTVTKAAMLDLVGWVLSLDAPVVEVRVTHGPDVLERTATGITRPDLDAAFPGVSAAATAGFRVAVDLAAVPVQAELAITADLNARETVLLATVTTAAV